MMDTLLDLLNDISKINVIYTIILVAAANNTTDLEFFINPFNIIKKILMNLSTTMNTYILPDDEGGGQHSSGDYSGIATTSIELQQPKPGLLMRLIRRLTKYSENVSNYIMSQITEHTATSIASFSVLIIVLSIICCFIISLMREEERRIKEQYKKLNTGSSSSFLAVRDSNCTDASTATSCTSYYHPGGGYQKIGSNHQLNSNAFNGSHIPTGSSSPFAHSSGNNQNKLRLFELRRETYFGLVRLLKPGCRTIVLLCDSQSRIKLLTRYYQCVYPYRKNKTLQFAFLLIEKNIGWYRELLRLALGEKRDLQINPINCIGTVLALNGFKKYFSVYHASESRCDPDEPCVLLEESLLDNLAEWLERLFSGKVNRYYVSYWPNRMR